MKNNRYNKGYMLSLIIFCFVTKNGMLGQVSAKQATSEQRSTHKKVQLPFAQLVKQVSDIVDHEYAAIEEPYKHLHAHSELSFKKRKFLN